MMNSGGRFRILYKGKGEGGKGASHRDGFDL